MMGAVAGNTCMDVRCWRCIKTMWVGQVFPLSATPWVRPRSSACPSERSPVWSSPRPPWRALWCHILLQRYSDIPGDLFFFAPAAQADSPLPTYFYFPMIDSNSHFHTMTVFVSLIVSLVYLDNGMFIPCGATIAWYITYKRQFSKNKLARKY